MAPAGARGGGGPMEPRPGFVDCWVLSEGPCWPAETNLPYAAA